MPGYHSGSRRPSNASSQEGNNIIDGFFSAVGISPDRAMSSDQRDQVAKTVRSRSNSVSSVRSARSAGSSIFYREGTGTNLMEQFDNTAARTPAKKNQGLTQKTEHY